MLIRFGSIITPILFATSSVLAGRDQVIFGAADMESFQQPEGRLPSLADLLTLETRASIFYSYARETELSLRLSESNDTAITVFVPTNKAVMALSRKPHEDPEAASMTEDEYYDAAKANIQRWVGAHIIPNTSIDFSTQTPYNTLTNGVTIGFKHITGAYHPPGEPKIINTDPAYFSSVKGSSLVDTDAAHFDLVKGPSQTSKVVEEVPEWKQYEINDGVHMIERREASNGVLYIIDGTVAA